MKAITVKEFDAVQYMRTQRDILSQKLANMTKEEVIAYFNKKKMQNTVKPSA